MPLHSRLLLLLLLRPRRRVPILLLPHPLLIYFLSSCPYPLPIVVLSWRAIPHRIGALLRQRSVRLDLPVRVLAPQRAGACPSPGGTHTFQPFQWQHAEPPGFDVAVRQLRVLPGPEQLAAVRKHWTSSFHGLSLRFTVFLSVPKVLTVLNRMLKQEAKRRRKLEKHMRNSKIQVCPTAIATAALPPPHAAPPPPHRLSVC